MSSMNAKRRSPRPPLFGSGGKLAKSKRPQAANKYSLNKAKLGARPNKVAK